MLGVVRYEKTTHSDIVIKEIAEEMGRGHTFKMQDVGIFFGEPEKTVPDPFFDGKGPDRTGCNFCGGCFIGCRNNGKNTLVKNYLYLAEKLGVQVFPETTAKLIREKSVGGGYQIDTVRTTSFLSKGDKKTFQAYNIILSAGVLGTLDLLFRCREKGTLNRLSPMLGQRVRTNSEVVTSVTSKSKEIDFTEGIAITSSIYPDDVTHIEPMRYPDGSDALNSIMTLLTGEGNRMTRPLKWLGNVFRHPIEFFKTLWPFGLISRTTIFLVMQTVDNSIRMFRKRRWWLPFTKKMVSTPEKMRKRVPAYIQVAQDVTKRFAEKVNGVPRNAVSEVLFDRGLTAHILGGCVMGSDPENGVIDGQNRVYGYEGMYVVDGSMVPANLGVNPSLTITAMAEHAMSHIPKKE
jgi:cholesterol oxidase